MLTRGPADVISRAERPVSAPGALERAWHGLRASLGGPSSVRRWVLRCRLPVIHWHARQLSRLDDTALDAQAGLLRQALRRRGVVGWLWPRAFALVREVARRELGMAHHDVQLLGGMVLLKGQVAEMQTGEGKTLTATLPAATAALAGIPVHIITVNDYLASRDADKMGPVYARLGLSVASVVHGMTPAERRRAYSADVVYCTNKELVFDYLRDTQELGTRRHPLSAHAARLQGRLTSHRLLLRGLHFAIVDEADSVLMDEARTPLILSGPAGEGVLDIALVDEAIAMAKRFVEDEHFVREQGQLLLTDSGKRYLESQVERLSRQSMAGHWQGRSRQQWLIQQALLAQHHFQRDVHYLVRDGKVLIIDEHTGRVMEDRRWEKGLQQMIERREGCEPSDPNITLARLTYQRFFRRYRHLSGMTGTAREVRRELWTTYRQRVVTVPPHRPGRRRLGKVMRCDTKAAKWEWICQRLPSLVAQGRAVLVTTVSLADAEALSARLKANDIAHRILSARQDADEAAVVAAAGAPGAVTLATSMAGRGTDIPLDPVTRGAGGLHVILAGHHDAARIDRQIMGRCARQGDPGSVEWVLSEEDELLTELDGWQRRLGRLATRLRRAQQTRERRHARERARLLEADWREDDQLGFSGRGE